MRHKNVFLLICHIVCKVCMSIMLLAVFSCQISDGTLVLCLLTINASDKNVLSNVLNTDEHSS